MSKVIDRSIWQSAKLLKHQYHKLDHSIETEVAIVGAGIVGLATCVHLRQRGYIGRIVLLEKSYPGFGATGKSGGILFVDDEYLPGSVRNYALMQRWLCSLKLADLIESGSGKLAGVEGEYNVDVVNPQELVCQLALSAESLGVEIYEQSELQSWSEKRDYIEMSVNNHRVKSRALLLSTGAYSPDILLKTLRLDVYEEDCIAVEVTPQLHIPWTYCKVIDNSRDYFIWGRRIGTSGFLFSNGPDCTSGYKNDQQRQEHLLCAVQKCLPDLTVTRSLAHWRGKLSRFADGRGWRITKVPGERRVLFVAGFDGQGLIAGCAAGFLAADLLSKLCSD